MIENLRKLNLVAAVLAVTAAICTVAVIELGARKDTFSVAERSSFAASPELIYSSDPKDSWNQIFRLLFSRTIKARLADDVTQQGPFKTSGAGFSQFRATIRLEDQVETGDRAINPLYPSFFSDAGVRDILSEPEFSQLVQALTVAANESSPRSAVARALMQADAWAAFDVIYQHKTIGSEQDQLTGQRRQALLSLLARFIKHTTLTSEEIRSLPDNYSLAQQKAALPDLFQPAAGWLEVQMTPHRLHDSSNKYRRFARVFLKPVNPAMDRHELLERLRQPNFYQVIDSLALVVQNLLIDNTYTPIPSRLTTEFQLRHFVRDALGNISGTDIQQFELSRKDLMGGGAGLREMDDTTPMYLPAAGNDYEFASPQFTRTGSEYAVRVMLRTRCAACHGRSLTDIFTLSNHDLPPLPALTVMHPSDNVHGWYVAGRKAEREEFEALRRQRE